MDTRQKAVLDVLKRIQSFLNRHSRLLVGVNRSRARAALDKGISAAETWETAQLEAKARGKSRLERRRALRQELVRMHLRPIIAFARAKEKQVPVLACLRMPSKDAPADAFLGACTRIAGVALDERRLFIARGFPQDFARHLFEAVTAFDVAALQYSLCRAEGAHATHTLDTLIRRGRGLARVLDALVVARIARSHRLMAEWRQATSRRTPAAEPQHVCGA